MYTASDERLRELAQGQTEQFVRGINLGKFVAHLNINKPLSNDPEQDSINYLPDVLSFIIGSGTLESSDQIDALVQGALLAVETAFNQHPVGKVA